MDFACCGLPTPFTDTIGSPENQLALVGPFRALQIIFVIGAPLFRLTPLFGVTLFGVFLTPVFFYVIQWFGENEPGRPKPAPITAAPTSPPTLPPPPHPTLSPERWGRG